MEETQWNDAITKAAIAAASLLFGAFLGHLLTVKRDKRKEFNDLADPISLVIEYQTIDPKPDCETDFRLIRRHFSGWQRKAFDVAVANYEQSLGPSNCEMKPNGMAIIDRERTRQAARELLGWLEHR